jgi:hypothetical protein
MLTAKQYSELKTKIEKYQSRSDKLLGQIEEVLKNLKLEFGVDSLEAARSLQDKMRRQYEKAETQFLEEYEQFQEKWDGVLS